MLELFKNKLNFELLLEVQPFWLTVVERELEIRLRP